MDRISCGCFGNIPIGGDTISGTSPFKSSEKRENIILLKRATANVESVGARPVAHRSEPSDTYLPKLALYAVCMSRRCSLDRYSMKGGRALYLMTFNVLKLSLVCEDDAEYALRLMEP